LQYQAIPSIDFLLEHDEPGGEGPDTTSFRLILIPTNRDTAGVFTAKLCEIDSLSPDGNTPNQLNFELEWTTATGEPFEKRLGRGESGPVPLAHVWWLNKTPREVRVNIPKMSSSGRDRVVVGVTAPANRAKIGFKVELRNIETDESVAFWLRLFEREAGKGGGVDVQVTETTYRKGNRTRSVTT
jgi:hypothetical protein